MKHTVNSANPIVASVESFNSFESFCSTAVVFYMLMLNHSILTTLFPKSVALWSRENQQFSVFVYFYKQGRKNLTGIKDNIIYEVCEKKNWLNGMTGIFLSLLSRLAFVEMLYDIVVLLPQEHLVFSPGQPIGSFFSENFWLW